MRKKLAAVLLTGALSLVAPDSFAATSQPPEMSAGGWDHGVAPHATRGIVKAIDATTLVITRFANRGEMTFKVIPSTRHEGTIVVGSIVSVRYREDGKEHVATAIAVQQPRD